MTMPLLVCRLAAGALAAGLVFAASAAVRADDKFIKIGALLPMSGPGSYFGAQDKQGVELALEQINRAGIGGYKLDVKYEDSSCSPLPATQAAKRLLEQYKPDVVIGEECSDATLAIMPLMEQAKVPFLNAGSSSIKITEPGNPWTFRIMPNEVMQGVATAASMPAPPCCCTRTPTPVLEMPRCSTTPSPSSVARSWPTSGLGATSTISPQSRRGSPG